MAIRKEVRKVRRRSKKYWRKRKMRLVSRMMTTKTRLFKISPKMKMLQNPKMRHSQKTKKTMVTSLRAKKKQCRMRKFQFRRIICLRRR